MTKFNLKEHIAKNKATFFGSLTEGQFSWMTQDTGQQIGSQDENTIPVYMFDDKGKYYYEKNYDGYGEFGGKDYYDLVAEMNGYTVDDAKELGGTFRELRGIGIKLAFDELEPKNGGPVLFPALVTKPDRFNYKTHDFTQEAKTDPNQSWYTPEEDDYYDQNDDDEDYNRYGDEDEEELEEGKKSKKYYRDAEADDAEHIEALEKDMKDDKKASKKIKENTKMKISEFKAKIKEMILAEVNAPINMVTTMDGKTVVGTHQYGVGFKSNEAGQKMGFKDNPTSIPNGTKMSSSKKDMNEDTFAPTSLTDFVSEIEAMLNEAEGLTPLQDYVYQYEKEISGEDKAQDFLDDIKQLNTPYDVYRYYAKKRGWEKDKNFKRDLNTLINNLKTEFPNLAPADDLTDLQRIAYEYTEERFGDEEAKNSLDQIKTLTTRQEFTDWVNQKLKNLDEAKDEEIEDVDVDIESPEVMDEPTSGISVTQNADADLTGTEKELQDNLEAALEAAKKIGDDKLQQQIGNSLTFFTRQHVVKENIKETLLLQKRAGIITETQYKQKLNEASEDEVPLTDDVKSFIDKAIVDSKEDGEFEELKEVDWFENELINDLIDLFPEEDYDSASKEVMDYIKDKIK